MLPSDDEAHAFVPYPDVPVSSASSGPLAGLTVAVKDIFDVAGYPTGCGQPTKLAQSGIKTATAPFVKLFLDAGAAFVGKTHTAELAYALDGINTHFGTPINPAAPDRVPGGSSSGSAAATASRLCDIGLGSDTGGAMRGPASYCGIFGLRLTHGRLPLDLTMPLAASLDTPGWFCGDAGTFLRVAEAVLGTDLAPLPETTRLLQAEDCFTLARRGPRRTLMAVADRIDRRLTPLRTIDVAHRGFDALYWAFRRIMGVESWVSQGDFVTRWRPEVATAIADRLAYARDLPDKDVTEARAVRDAFRSHLHALLGQDGVIMQPTMPGPAPLLTASNEELEAERSQAHRLLCLGSLSGCPQVSIPVGIEDGAPIGLSLIGPPGSDLSLVRLAVRVWGVGLGGM